MHAPSSCMSLYVLYSFLNDSMLLQCIVICNVRSYMHLLYACLYGAIFMPE